MCVKRDLKVIAISYNVWMLLWSDLGHDLNKAFFKIIFIRKLEIWTLHWLMIQEIIMGTSGDDP
jgi:hypothetical protein